MDCTLNFLTYLKSWNKKTVCEHFPALQNLAAQIATALKQAENFQTNLQNQWGGSGAPTGR